jgi:hypothetical protein
MKYLALAIPLLTLMPMVNSSHAQTSGSNGSNYDYRKSNSRLLDMVELLPARRTGAQC